MCSLQKSMVDPGRNLPGFVAAYSYARLPV
jgi:hypothetical protein